MHKFENFAPLNKLEIVGSEEELGSLIYCCLLILVEIQEGNGIQKVAQ
jgi:hypothetical protein